MAPAQNPLRLLLVEDSEDDAYFFLRALRLVNRPTEVVRASDGGEAVAHLRRALAHGEPLPDYVFLDLKLPTRTGFEVLEWIRGQDLPAEVCVSVLSGSDQSADRERAAALGASGYYVKPILPGQLALLLAGPAGLTTTHPSAARLERGKELA